MLDWKGPRVRAVAETAVSYAAVIAFAAALRDENMARIVGTLGLFPVVARYHSKLAPRLGFAGLAGSVIEGGPVSGVAGLALGLITWVIAYHNTPRRNYDHKDNDHFEIH